MMPSNGQLTVPPGFRFHPTDEELLYYYLRKKVSYEAIDLDVIREIDLNKLEPWDLKEKCRIGSGPQNEWYFFSHKDKKYPTGTRTNRATAAGFWKATGRDKAIHLGDSKRIGMRKTLVFYTGRAPHGQKTDWIMHEYRLDDDNAEIQEDGWVVCRVFKKKNQTREFQQEMSTTHHHQEESYGHMKASGSCAPLLDHHQPKQYHHHHHPHLQSLYDYTVDGSMHLPQLFSPESAVAAANAAAAAAPSFVSPLSLNTMDLECSQNLLRLTTSTTNSTNCGQVVQQQERFNNGDWTFLDKLLASHNNNNTHHHSGLDHLKGNQNPSSSSQLHHVANSAASAQRFPFQYLGCDNDMLKFSK